MNFLGSIYMLDNYIPTHNTNEIKMYIAEVITLIINDNCKNDQVTVFVFN